MNRREFLGQSTIAAAGAVCASSGLAAVAPNEKVTVAVVGVRGRGNALLTGFATRPTVDVKYVCDLDENVL